MIMLEQNYRSSQRILQAANDVIGNNTSQIPKSITNGKSTKGKKFSYFVLLMNNKKHSSSCKTIQEMMENENRTLDDFAILYRTNAQSRVMEEVLVKSNMAYTIVGGTKFYDRKEIKDLLAYLTFNRK